MRPAPERASRMERFDVTTEELEGCWRGPGRNRCGRRATKS
jgi:hypothetical protein